VVLIARQSKQGDQN